MDNQQKNSQHTGGDEETISIKSKQNIDTQPTSSNDILSQLDSVDDNDSDSQPPPLESVENDTKKKPSSKNIKKNIKISDDESEPEVEPNGFLDILNNGDLKKKIIKKGNSVRPQRGSKVTIRLETRLHIDEDHIGTGQLIEDETFDKFVTVLGDSDLHQGLDLVIPLMELHEVSLCIIKPRFCYGQIGNKNIGISEEATLELVVELLNIDSQSDNIYGDSGDPEDAVSNHEPLAERIQIGNYKKARGNFWFERGEYSLAIQCYRGALKYLDANEKELKLMDEEKKAIQNGKIDQLENSNELEVVKDLIDKRAQTYNNLAATQMKLQAFDQAMRSVEDSLLLKPENVKALYRRAKLRFEKGDLEEAIDDLKKALIIDPESQSVAVELDRLNKILAKQLKEQRQLYRRMLQNNEPNTTANDKSKGVNKDSDTNSKSTNSNNKQHGSKNKKNQSKQTSFWLKYRWPAISVGVATTALVMPFVYNFFK